MYYINRVSMYGVATVSRMLKNIGLFCKRALQKRPVFCKETCIFKYPTHRSHPIRILLHKAHLIYRNVSIYSVNPHTYRYVSVYYINRLSMEPNFLVYIKTPLSMDTCRFAVCNNVCIGMYQLYI